MEEPRNLDLLNTNPAEIASERSIAYFLHCFVRGFIFQLGRKSKRGVITAIDKRCRRSH